MSLHLQKTMLLHTLSHSFFAITGISVDRLWHLICFMIAVSDAAFALPINGALIRVLKVVYLRKALVFLMIKTWEHADENNSNVNKEAFLVFWQSTNLQVKGFIVNFPSHLFKLNLILFNNYETYEWQIYITMLLLSCVIFQSDLGKRTLRTCLLFPMTLYNCKFWQNYFK